ncbi:MAG: hypothetical protein ABI690_24000 [Chloroflexota bacterium]
MKDHAQKPAPDVNKATRDSIPSDSPSTSIQQALSHRQLLTPSLLLQMQRTYGNHLVRQLVAPSVQRDGEPWHTIGAISLDLANQNVELADGYATLLKDFKYLKIIGVLEDYGIKRAEMVRLTHTLYFLENGATEIQTRFALTKANNNADLFTLMGMMLTHKGQQAALEWALAKAGNIQGAKAYLEYAASLNYDTAMADWAYAQGAQVADDRYASEAADIDSDSKARLVEIKKTAKAADTDLTAIKSKWAKNNWTYNAAEPDKSSSKRGSKPGKSSITDRTAAHKAVDDAAAAKVNEGLRAEGAKANAALKKGATQKEIATLIAKWVGAGVSAKDTQTLYTALGVGPFQLLFDTFGGQLGGLVSAMEPAGMVAMVKGGSIVILKRIIDHLDAATTAKTYKALDGDSADVYELWDVLGTQLKPMLALAPAKLLIMDHFPDNKETFKMTFKALGAGATTLYQQMTDKPFIKLIENFQLAHITAFVTGAVPGARLTALIAKSTRIPALVAKCSADTPGFITLLNNAAVTTDEIYELTEIMGNLGMTTQRVIALLGMSQDAATLIYLLDKQRSAQLSNAEMDTMLQNNAANPLAPHIADDLFYKLARDAQNENIITGSRLQLLLSDDNTVFPATITYVGNKKTSYDQGAASNYSEFYNVTIPNPDPTLALINGRGWEIHLHRVTGGTISSGSIKKTTQRYNTGAGVFREVLPKALENDVRAHKGVEIWL